MARAQAESRVAASVLRLRSHVGRDGQCPRPAVPRVRPRSAGARRQWATGRRLLGGGVRPGPAPVLPAGRDRQGDRRRPVPRRPGRTGLRGGLSRGDPGARPGRRATHQQLLPHARGSHQGAGLVAPHARIADRVPVSRGGARVPALGASPRPGAVAAPSPGVQLRSGRRRRGRQVRQGARGARPRPHGGRFEEVRRQGHLPGRDPARQPQLRADDRAGEGDRRLKHVALFIVTEAGVILVDANGQVNPRTPYLIKEAIRSVTAQPVKYLVYSHSAFDHSTGGAVFADTARFVGHKNTVDRIKAANDPTTPAPDLVFDKKTTLELGGRVVDLYPADLSPTDDYIVVHYPVGRLAMFVDLMQPRNVPFRTLLGHPERIVERLQWLEAKLDFDVIVSGHATPQMSGTKQDVVEQRVYYRDLTDAIATARAAGLADGSAEMTTRVRSILHPKYGAWRRFDEFLALNIQGMIAWRAGKSPAAH